MARMRMTKKEGSWWRGGRTTLLGTAMKRKDYDNIEHKPVANIQYSLNQVHVQRSPIRKATGNGLPKSSNLGVKHQFLAFLFIIDESCIVPMSSLC